MTERKELNQWTKHLLGLVEGLVGENRALLAQLGRSLSSANAPAVANLISGGPILPRQASEMAGRYDQSTGYYRLADGTMDGCFTELDVLRCWYNICMMVRPKVIVETGAYFGLSTCHLAAALRDLGSVGKVYAIDPWVKDHFWIGSDLEPLVHFVPKTTEQAFKEGVFKGLEIDVLVIDSEHTYRTTMYDIVHLEPQIREGGYIVMHDTLLHEGCGRAVEQLHQSGRFEVITFDTPRTMKWSEDYPPFSMGTTVARKIKSGAQFEFDQEWMPRDEGVPSQKVPHIRLAMERAATAKAA